MRPDAYRAHDSVHHAAVAPQSIVRTMRHMTDDPRLPEPARKSAGAIYSVLAGAIAAALLSPAVLLIGITMTVIAEVARGENIAWQSSVAMNYTFIGVPALLLLVMLAIPATLLRAARERFGEARATRWAGVAGTTWFAAIAVGWLLQAFGSPGPAFEAEETWYAVAFALAAAVAAIATALAERRALRAGLVLGGVTAGGLVALGAALVLVWGSPPRIPVGAQVVHVSVVGSVVRLEPSTVLAGDVHFVVDSASEATVGDTFAFISSGYGDEGAPLPLDDDAAARLALGDYQDTATEGGWPTYAELTLLEGRYAFVIFGAGGEMPDRPPASVTILEVIHDPDGDAG